MTPAVIKIFFKNDAPLERIHASPKQPQSSIGDDTKSQPVSGNSTAIISPITTGTVLRYAPIAKRRPDTASVAAIVIPQTSVTERGIVISIAAKYSSIL